MNSIDGIDSIAFKKPIDSIDGFVLSTASDFTIVLLSQDM